MRAFWQVVVCCALASGAPPAFELPSTVVPRKHSLRLTVDPSQPVMTGRMEIALEVMSPTREIWLNARDITDVRATINQRPAKIVSAANEFLGLEASELLSPGNATVVIQFQSKLDDKLTVGAYRRKVEGEWYAYTTFTPIEARRAFPCFDEPRYKTPWDITLRVRESDGAYANSAERSRTVQDGWKTIEFEETPPLPAEVVAFVVGPFDVLDAGQAGEAHTPIRVLLGKGHAAEGAAAAHNTAAVLERLEAYTGIAYPFSKLDQVAVSDFEYSAVENPGLISYLARAILMAPDTDFANSYSLRLLQAHEMSHQWFGNFVTQTTWNDVWLSEGFATWLSEKIMDEEQPRERAHLASIVTRERIMKSDTNRDRPVRVMIESRKESLNIYNRLVYDKAAAVLTMVEHWLGEQKFQAGARAYLRDHSFRTASVQDFSQALLEASGVNPWPVLHSFLDLPGVPVLRGAVECQKDAAVLHVSQTSNYTVPFCWRADSGEAACDVLDSPSKSVGLKACPAWTYFNADGAGYYRTVWNASTLSALRPAELSFTERLTLVHDLRAQDNDKFAARTMLERLSKDDVTEIAQAARDALK